MCGVENITFQFPKAAAPLFSDLTFSLSSGERVALMGENGSGKSTLALLLAGLLHPKSGTVQLPSSLPGSLPVGLLFQNPDDQLVASTVERDIAVGLENLCVPVDEMKQRVNEIMERFRITHLRERLVAELSGGEKVRVALAGILVTSPKLVILDEPDSYLDEAGKQILLTELRALCAANPEISILHITQYAHIAQTYPRCIRLSSGKIVHDGASKPIAQPSASVSQRALEDAQLNKPAVLTVTSLAHSYEEQSTFEHISFALNSNQVMAVVGASGSGKSTLALVLCGLLKQTSGTIHVDGVDSAKAVTMLFQFPEKQFFLPTCREELVFGPKNYGKNPSDTEIHHWLTQVGLDALTYRERDPLSLSGGEKRRLAFALPFGLPAQFIIFDEPTAGLDEQGIALFGELIDFLKRQNKGVIIITHDGPTVKSLADSVLVLSSQKEPKLFSTEQFFAGNHQSGLLSTF